MTKRALLSLLPWVLCIPALAMSLGMAVGGGLEALAHVNDPSDEWMQHYNTGRWGAAPLFVAGVAIPLAWLALLAMTIAWVTQRRLPRWLPVAGTAAAGAGLLAFAASIGLGALMGIAVALPGMLFAVHLCYYHLTGRGLIPA